MRESQTHKHVGRKLTGQTSKKMNRSIDQILNAIREIIAKNRTILDEENLQVVYTLKLVAVYFKKGRRGRTSAIRTALRYFLPSRTVLGLDLAEARYLKLSLVEN